MGHTWVLSAPGGPHVGPMNIAIRDTGHQTRWAFHRNIGPLIPHGLAEILGVMWGDPSCWLHAPQMLDGVAVLGLCRLVHFTDVLLLQIINHYPGTMRRSIVILVAAIVFKVLPIYPARCPDTPRHWRSYPGAQGVIWHPCGMVPDMDRTPPALTLAAWQSCWKRSPGSRRTLMRPSTGHGWKRDHLFRWRETKQPQSSSVTSVPNLGGDGDDWLSIGASSLSCEHGILWPQVGC